MSRITLALFVVLAFCNICLGQATTLRFPPFYTPQEEELKGTIVLNVDRNEIIDSKQFHTHSIKLEAALGREFIHFIQRIDTDAPKEPSTYIEKIFNRTNGHLLTINHIGDNSKGSIVLQAKGSYNEDDIFPSVHGFSVLMGRLLSSRSSLWTELAAVPVREDGTFSTGDPQRHRTLSGQFAGAVGATARRLTQVTLSQDVQSSGLAGVKFYRLSSRPKGERPVACDETLKCRLDDTTGRPAAFSHTAAYKLSTGRAASVIMEMTVESLSTDRPAPAVDGEVYRPKSAVPNGHPVQTDSNANIEYIWQDGQVVRKVDGRALRVAQTARQLPPERTSYWIWALAGLVVAGFVLVRRLLRRPRRSVAGGG